MVCPPDEAASALASPRGASAVVGASSSAEAQAHLRSIAELSTLTASWSGAPAEHIAESLLAAMEATLHPSLSYLRIESPVPASNGSIEFARAHGRPTDSARKHALNQTISAWAAAHDPDEVLVTRDPTTGRPLCICAYRLGDEPGCGVLAAGFEQTCDDLLVPTPLQRTLLRIAASQLITACKNLALQQQAEAARHETQALYDVSRTLAAELDLETILQKTTDAATRLTLAQFGAFFHNVTDGEGESYMLYTLSGVSREAFRDFDMPRNTPIFEHTFRGRGPVRIDDVLGDPRYGTKPPHHGMPPGHIPVRSYLAVPVTSRTGDVLGGLFFGHRTPGVFTERAERIATGIASQAAVALDNARLFARSEREIVQRKAAEEALRASEGRLRMVTDAVPALISYIDADGRYRFNNGGYEQWFGHKSSALVGKHLSAVVGEAGYARIRPFVEAALAGERVAFELEVPYAHGGTRFVLAHYIPEVAADGMVLGFYAMIHDISERRAMEKSLRDSEARLQMAKQAARLGIHDFDVSTGEIQWDGRVREIWGVDETTPISYDLWLQGIHPEDRDAAAAAVDRALDPSHEGGYFAEYRVVRRRDGAERWVEATGQVTFVDRMAVRLVGTVRDITDQKGAESALREADRRKNEFLATLAHELRNPLAPLGMAASILRTSKNDPARIDEMTTIIERQSAQLVRLIDDLLDVNRITRGKITLRAQRVELTSLIAEAVEATRSQRDERQLTLSVAPQQPLELNADPVRITQILGNLLNNACRYTPRGGTIHIWVEQDAESAAVHVRDNGIGIDPAQLTNIFEMFTQVESAITRAPGGLGMGLPLARSLAELHGGSLHAHSAGIGKGSDFVLRLPLASCHEQAGHSLASAARVEEATANPRRILAVDDFPDALQSITLFLQMEGHEVYTAANGTQALRVVEAERPDVVLLDIGLPDIDGFEVARKIRSRPWGRDLLLIAMTGWGQAEDKRKAVDAGFDAHLTKPADLQALEGLLTQPRARPRA